MEKLFVEKPGKKVADALSGFGGVPTFDTRFIAMGLGINHDALLLAVLEHKDALEEYGEYGEVVVTDGTAELTAVQAIAAVLFIGDWYYNHFLVYLLYETLYHRVIAHEGRIFHDHRFLAPLWKKAMYAMGTLQETHATVERPETHRSPELAAEIEESEREGVEETLETASLAHPAPFAESRGRKRAHSKRSKPIESADDAIEAASEAHAQPQSLDEVVYGGFLSGDEMDDYTLTGKLPERYAGLATA